MGAGAVGYDGEWNTGIAQFPCREPGSLVSRTGLIDIDKYRFSLLMGAVDGGEGCPVIDEGKPACIAMGLDAEPVADQLAAVFADLARVIRILLGDLVCDDDCLLPARSALHGIPAPQHKTDFGL